MTDLFDYVNVKNGTLTWRFATCIDNTSTTDIHHILLWKISLYARLLLQLQYT